MHADEPGSAGDEYFHAISKMDLFLPSKLPAAPLGPGRW
jgi:hypothetical protein